MRRRFRLPPVVYLFSALAWGFAPSNRAQEGEQPLIAREVVVLVVDRFGETANGPGMFSTALPGGGNVKRDAAAGGGDGGASGAGEDSGGLSGAASGGAMPGGFITFSGGASGVGPFDVLVELEGGEFMGAWPRPDRRRSDRLLWHDLRAVAGADDAPTPPPAALPAGHWMAPLRSESRRLLRDNRAAERFLFYDAAVAYTTPMTVETEGDSYRLVPTRDEAVRDAFIIKRGDGGGWTVVSADASGGGNRVADARPAATQPDPAASQPATTQAAGGGHTGAGGGGVVVSQPVDAATPAEALVPIVRALEASDALNEPELAYARAVLERHAFDKAGLTVVYRLDGATLDRLLPLDIAPAPAETRRVGMIILRNADPAVGERIVALVAQLGDASWSKREDAQRQLAALGKAAVPELEKRRGDEDPEVRYRVEQLLEAEPAG